MDWWSFSFKINSPSFAIHEVVDDATRMLKTTAIFPQWQRIIHQTIVTIPLYISLSPSK